MKRFNIAVIVLMLLMLSACKEESVYITPLIQNEIFTQEENKYFVFFYSDDCGFCETTKPLILEYLKTIQKANLDKRKVYGFDLSSKENKFDNGTSDYGIFRVYEEESGNSTSSKYRVNGITKWNDLYIAGVPCLISITLDEMLGIKKAYLVAENKQEIQAILNSQINP